MAHLKFDTYRINATGTGTEHVGCVEFDTEVEAAIDQQRIVNRVLELNKDKDVLIAPNCAEAAWVLQKPKQRGRKKEVPAHVNKFIHERRVIHEDPIKRIPMLVFAKFDELELSEEIVKACLNQERDTDAEGFDELRVRALEMKGTKGARRKHTDEDKDEWVRMHVEEGMSGSDIGRELGINNATINAELSKRGVQRNSRGRVRAVVAEQVTE